MIVFHKDDIDRFEAAVTIGGTAGSERMVRLVLSFKSRKLMYDGVFKDNRVIVEIPKMMDVSENSGVVTLEVIADRTFFEAYTSDFELTMKKSVEVDEVSVIRSEPVSIVVEDINLQKQEEVEIFVEDCATKNKMSAQRYIDDFNDDDELETDFPDSVRTWAKDVFIDTDSREALIAMTKLSRKLNN